MKRIFSLIMVALFVTAMAVGGAWASEIDIDAEAEPMVFNNPDTAGTTSGAVTIDNLWTSGGILDNVDLGNSANWPNTAAGGSERAIGYYSSVALKTNSTLKFTFTNGAINADATLFLLAWDTTSGGWVTVATLNDFHTDANGNYDWIRMQVSTVAAGLTFTDSEGNPLGASLENTMPANAVMVLSKEDAATGYDGVEIVANTTADVTVKVDEAKDDNANPLTAPLASSETLLTSIAGVTAKIQYADSSSSLQDGPATSTIDVDANRLSFVNEGRSGALAGGDTDATHSEAALLVTNDAEFGLTLNEGDSYTLTVERDDISGVNDNGLTYDTNLMTKTTGANEWTYDTDFGTIDCITAAKAILITVNGSDVLNTGIWKTSLTIDPDQDAYEPRNLGEITLLDKADSHNWTINGWQAIYPYFNADKSVTTYGSYIVINNESSVVGKVFFDIISTSDDAMRSNLDNYSNKQVTGKETLAAGESQVYLMDDLIDAFGLADSTAKRNALRITVTAPTSGITGTAFMDDPGSGGKRTMPLLTDSDTGYKHN